MPARNGQYARRSGREGGQAMQGYMNIYAQTFMVATRMDPALARQFRLPLLGWLSRRVRAPVTGGR
jgi:hypothetical protein